MLIAPAGGKNAVIRALWTPFSLKVEQRVNKNDVGSAHLPLSTRSSTFDGHMKDSEIRNIPGQNLREDIAEQLEWIVDHMTSLIPYTLRVWSGEFYFKMGQDGRLYLLWCSSLHFEHLSSEKAGSERELAHTPNTPRCIHSEDCKDERVQGLAGQEPADESMPLPLNPLHPLSKTPMCPACGRYEGQHGCERIQYNVRSHTHATSMNLRQACSVSQLPYCRLLYTREREREWEGETVSALQAHLSMYSM